MSPTEKQIPPEQILREFLSKSKILIADSAASSRAGLSRTLVNLGASMPLIKLVDSYPAAIAEMSSHKPQFVVCDYDLGNGLGLGLLQEQRKVSPDSITQQLFILVTGNTSQSAVARAAEEDVDAFVLKPYTLDMLRNCITQAVITKMNPSEYSLKIRSGRGLITDGKIAEARKIFEEATTLDSKPSLALGYLGQADATEKALDSALEKYKQGLEYNKIHYKCMTGMFDTLLEKKDYDNAYDTVKKLSRYFPANPQRLIQVLRLAITTRNYDDIEKYYQIFINIDARNDELIRYVCAALVVCGKFYLQTNVNSRAIELFKKAAITGNGKTKVLREIVSALTEVDQLKDALEFFKKFPPESQKQADYLISALMIDDKQGDSSIVIEKGRKLIKDGIEDPVVYRILIHHSRLAGLNDAAEELTRTAISKWPDVKSKFEAENRPAEQN